MKVKVSNMCRIIDGDNVLVQMRTKQDWPGITFPGGKLESNESVYQSCVREIKEETGYDVFDLVCKGTIHYDVVGKDEKWIIFLYDCTNFHGTLHPQANEDEVYWMKQEELKDAPLSNDLDIYLKVYEDDTIQEAHALWMGNDSSAFTFY